MGKKQDSYMSWRLNKLLLELTGQHSKIPPQREGREREGRGKEGRRTLVFYFETACYFICSL